ncbi:hypothetical protein COV20_01580 [Candidatus Woesearchaeota archaeon CG10_big_fil_rev_8_21_14_0_10_45_16]|nr:MAG: hypothetical protein COV20_01580 [Candidatus Woesearchaeota archaeon CG10_big_fil_rev_8_21_14_0_10_45_16]
MALAQVQAEIVVEAEKKAVEATKQAEKEAQEVLKKAKDEVSQYKKDAEKQAATLLEAMERKVLAAARSDAQRLEMNARKEIMDDLFDNAAASLQKLGKTEKQKFLQSLLEKAEKEIKVDTVYAAAADTSLVKGVKNVKEAPISGGLMAETKEGDISVNLSVEELLASLREELSMKLSEVLFNE